MMKSELLYFNGSFVLVSFQCLLPLMFLLIPICMISIGDLTVTLKLYALILGVRFGPYHQNILMPFLMPFISLEANLNTFNANQQKPLIFQSKKYLVLST